MVVDLDATVNNIKPLSVAMETQQWIILGRLWSYETFCIAVSNISVLWSSCKLRRCSCEIVTKSGLYRQIFVYVRSINFTKIRPVGAALIYADGQTDGRTYMTKLIGAFRYFCECAAKIKILLRRSGSVLTFTLHSTCLQRVTVVLKVYSK